MQGFCRSKRLVSAQKCLCGGSVGAVLALTSVCDINRTGSCLDQLDFMSCFQMKSCVFQAASINKLYKYSINKSSIHPSIHPHMMYFVIYVCVCARARVCVCMYVYKHRPDSWWLWKGGLADILGGHFFCHHIIT